MEDLDCNELRSFGNTVFLSSDGTGAVCSMAIGIDEWNARISVVAVGSSPLEVFMAQSDTSIDEIGKHAIASRGIVNILGRASSAMRDRRKTPFSLGLNSSEQNLPDRFNSKDLSSLTPPTNVNRDNLHPSSR